MKKRYIAAFVAFTVSFAACQASVRNSGGMFISGTDTITVALEAANPPMEYSGASGIQGFDADLMREIAAFHGWGVSFEDMSWDKLFAALSEGSADVVCSSVVATPERTEAGMIFSVPYLKTGVAMMLPEGAPDISAAEDLDGKVIGVLAYGYASERLREVLAGTGEDFFEVRVFAGEDEAFASLSEGLIDILAADEPLVPGLLAKGGCFDASFVLCPVEYAVALEGSSLALRRKINEAVAALTEDGTVERLWRKHFDWR